MEAEVKVVDDLTAAAVEVVVATIESAVAERGAAVVCLSGGSTPMPLYRRLAHRQDLPWEDVVFVWGDERYVPHDHPDSNYGAAKAALIDEVAAREENVLPWPAGPTPHEAAAAYGRDLSRALGAGASFDLNIMGLGSDAHTASLFPGTGAVSRDEDTFALEAPGIGWRLTMGAGRLSASRVTLFLVSGEEKRRALELTFGRAASGPQAQTPDELDRYPGRAIGALERLLVVTDIAFE